MIRLSNEEQTKRELSRREKDFLDMLVRCVDVSIKKKDFRGEALVEGVYTSSLHRAERDGYDVSAYSDLHKKVEELRQSRKYHRS